jgi:hypothetical protein
MPNSFCETPDGYLLAADGLGPVLVWDGFWPQARQAGVPKPTTPITLAGAAVGFGRIVGAYTAYVRYLDDRGQVSDLSPISAEATISVASGGVTGATTTSPIRLTMPAHGLTNAARIKVSGVVGQAGANGTWDIVVIDANAVQLTDSTSSGDYVSGGTWTAGAAGVAYSNIPSTDDPRVRRKQILRNTDGQAQTYYVDIDTIDLSTTTAVSVSTDEFLQTQEAVVLVDADGRDLANLHAEPPQHKPILLAHQGRVFGAGQIEYTEGAVAVTYGSKTVTGIGTEWTAAAAGRFLYVVGGLEPCEIASVNTADPDAHAAQPVHRADRRLRRLRRPPAAGRGRLTAAYTEAGLPESWPAVNALSLADDGDVVTGLMSKGSFLYILKRRHIYRLTFQDGPAEDGGLFLAGPPRVRQQPLLRRRGGRRLHAGRAGRPRVRPGQVGRVDLHADPRPVPRRPGAGRRRGSTGRRPGTSTASTTRATETIRWFVAMSGQYLPRHALCFQYTLQRWWLEEFPFPVASSPGRSRSPPTRSAAPS